MKAGIERMAVFCLGLLLMLSGTATAVDRNWTGSGSGNLWTNTANWDGAPAAGDQLWVDGGTGTPMIDMNDATVYGNVNIGKNNTASLDVVSGGYLRTGGGVLILGQASGGNGTLDMTGGNIDTKFFLLGKNGATGTGNVSGGTIKTSNGFVLGESGGFTAATLNLSGTATLESGYQFASVGRRTGGTGTLDVSGNATAKFGSNLFVGQETGTGVINISDSGRVEITTANGSIRVGNDSGASGTIDMTGGTLKAKSFISLGHAGTGSMTMSAGAVETSAFVVGINGAGDFDMSGGTITLDSHVRVGEGAGEGVWTMSGGLLVATNYIAAGWGATGAGEMNTINMSDGELRTGDLRLGLVGDGTLNLSGGEINVNIYGSGAYTNGLVFNSNGGEGLLDITADGTLNWLGGNFTNEVNAFITSGDIINSIEGELSVIYNSGSNITTVTAIPEPATLGMIAFLGGVMFWIRRTFMI